MRRLSRVMFFSVLLMAGAAGPVAYARQSCDANGVCRDERSERAARWAAVDLRNLQDRQLREERRREYDARQRRLLVGQLNGLLAENRCDEAQALAASKPWPDIRAKVDAHCEASKAHS